MRAFTCTSVQRTHVPRASDWLAIIEPETLEGVEGARVRETFEEGCRDEGWTGGG